MLTYEDFGRAAAANDAIAEERGFEVVVDGGGTDAETLDRVAEQRALRVALIVTGNMATLKNLIRGNRLTPMKLTDEQKNIIELLKPAYVDAILIGIRAERERLLKKS
jgi:hypothetical protein